MKAKDFNKLLKNETPKEIIRKYCYNEIFLTNFQLDKVIKLKQEQEK